MRYEVRARRSGSWWALEVPAVPGVFSQVRRLEQAEAMAADAIATALDIDPSTVEISVVPEAPAELQAALADVLAKRAAAEDVRTAASAAMRRFVADAQRQGLTVRDIAALLGISFQQVSKLSAQPDVVIHGPDGTIAVAQVKTSPTGQRVSRRGPYAAGPTSGRYVAPAAAKKAAPGSVKKRPR